MCGLASTQWIPIPQSFFKKLGVEFDGTLFIRYPVRMTFAPVSVEELNRQECLLGVGLPADYKQLLQQFGQVHLPGAANIIIRSPQDAFDATRAAWSREAVPLSVLAISSYHRTSDGNSIGFIRNGKSFGPEIYEFDHELVHHGDDPKVWTRKVGDSLAEFLLEYLEQEA